jgi:multiple sugar transport system substrate-binding protein
MLSGVGRCSEAGGSPPPSAMRSGEMEEMNTSQLDHLRVDRRSALKMTAGAGLAAAGRLGFAAMPARAAETTLAIWTGFPELVPFYQGVANAYGKLHPEVGFTFFSTSLREAEQKLSAAVPTGTGPDIFDIGTNISVNFIGAGLIKPNEADIDQYLRSGGWNDFVVDFFTLDGQSYGLPLMEGSRASMYYNKAMFAEAGIAGPPSTFPELVDAARKLTKIDASGRMTRSGISLRLSGQGSGITEKFRFVLEPAGGSLLVKTADGKYHNGFDNDAGRSALQFYVDAVQKDKIDDPKIQHDADAFVAGTTAMLFREAWVIGEIQQKNPKLDYGVAPIPRWRAGDPHKMLLQPWGIYVNGQSANPAAAWDFLKFLTSADNGLRLTTMTGWLSGRQDVDWAPLLKQTPQFETFVAPPKDVVYYVEPILPVWDEIQSRMADQLTAAYVNPELGKDPAKVADAIHQMAEQTDQLLKEADLYSAS